MHDEYLIHIKCPWCGRGETLSNARAPIQTSQVCSKCKNVYIIDWKSLKAKKASPQKRKTH